MDVTKILRILKVSKLMISDLNENPIEQFKIWLDDAKLVN